MEQLTGLVDNGDVRGSFGDTVPRLSRRGSVPFGPPNLLPTDAHVWLFDPHHLNDEEVKRAATRLTTTTERQRADRFARDHDRLAYIAARALARTVLSAYCGLATAAAVAFTSNRFGKPAMDLGGLRHPVSFNLSHTRGLIALAVALDREVGVDVEAIRYSSPWRSSIGLLRHRRSISSALFRKPPERARFLISGP